MPDKGVLIACGDDKEIKILLKEYKKRVITYGFNGDNDYILERVHISGDQTFFWVSAKGVPLGEFVIRVVGEHNALNADDYAHHPTELTKTLQALRKQYPKKKIIALFQPHTYSRTKKLFDDFLHAFESVDTVILTDIYASLREKKDSTVSSKQLAYAMEKHHKAVLYLPNLSDVIKYINQNRFRSDTVLVTLGAGDVYTIHEKLEFQ